MSVSDSHLQQLAVRYPQRATCWQLRSKKLTVDRMPLLMGIVNVTPDSFSDGGRYLESNAAIEHGLQLAEDGADILDIGGESTRPYADKISEQEELQRVVDVVAGLAKQTQIPISIDTSKAKVAEAAIAVGAEIINDVTGLEGDLAMLEVAARSQAGVCAMHMQGTPQTMQDAPAYKNVVEEILSYLRSRFAALLAAGIHPERICLDPGIGFGKTHQHNLTLLANAWRFHELAAPILVGHSRKGFLAKMRIDNDPNRTMATVGASLSLAANGIQILRVHDVLPVRQALLSFVAAGGVDGQALQLDENKKVDRT